MNGRIYDPLLGRFDSADLVVPDPSNLQSYNRYSYVRNNPLTLTDPNGFTDSEEEAKRRREAESRARATVISERGVLGYMVAGDSAQQTISRAGDIAASSAADRAAPAATPNTDRASDNSVSTGSHGGELHSKASPTAATNNIQGSDSSSITAPLKRLARSTLHYVSHAVRPVTNPMVRELANSLRSPRANAVAQGLIEHLPIGQRNRQFLSGWVSGSLPARTVYGPNSPESVDMRNSSGAMEMRDNFQRGITTTNYDTFDAFVGTVGHVSSTAFQVGGFAEATVADNRDGTLIFTVQNRAGAESFFYHAADNLPDSSGPMHNVDQTFIWTEPK